MQAPSTMAADPEPPDRSGALVTTNSPIPDAENSPRTSNSNSISITVTVDDDVDIESVVSSDDDDDCPGGTCPEPPEVDEPTSKGSLKAKVAAPRVETSSGHDALDLSSSANDFIQQRLDSLFGERLVAKPRSKDEELRDLGVLSREERLRDLSEGGTGSAKPGRSSGQLLILFAVMLAVVTYCGALAQDNVDFRERVAREKAAVAAAVRTAAVAAVQTAPAAKAKSQQAVLGSSAEPAGVAHDAKDTVHRSDDVAKQALVGPFAPHMVQKAENPKMTSAPSFVQTSMRHQRASKAHKGQEGAFRFFLKHMGMLLSCAVQVRTTAFLRGGRDVP